MNHCKSSASHALIDTRIQKVSTRSGWHSGGAAGGSSAGSGAGVASASGGAAGSAAVPEAGGAAVPASAVVVDERALGSGVPYLMRTEGERIESNRTLGEGV